MGEVREDDDEAVFGLLALNNHRNHQQVAVEEEEVVAQVLVDFAGEQQQQIDNNNNNNNPYTGYFYAVVYKPVNNAAAVQKIFEAGFNVIAQSRVKDPWNKTIKKQLNRKLIKHVRKVKTRAEANEFFQDPEGFDRRRREARDAKKQANWEAQERDRLRKYRDDPDYNLNQRTYWRREHKPLYDQCKILLKDGTTLLRRALRSRVANLTKPFNFLPCAARKEEEECEENQSLFRREKDKTTRYRSSTFRFKPTKEQRAALLKVHNGYNQIFNATIAELNKLRRSDNADERSKQNNLEYLKDHVLGTEKTTNFSAHKEGRVYCRCTKCGEVFAGGGANESLSRMNWKNHLLKSCTFINAVVLPPGRRAADAPERVLTRADEAAVNRISQHDEIQILTQEQVIGRVGPVNPAPGMINTASYLPNDRRDIEVKAVEICQNWYKNVPAHIRVAAVEEAYTANQACWRRWQKRQAEGAAHNPQWNLHFRRKHAKGKKTFAFPTGHICEFSFEDDKFDAKFFPRTTFGKTMGTLHIGDTNNRVRDFVQGKDVVQTRFVYDARNNHHFMVVVTKVEKTARLEDTNGKKICSLDLGIHPFVTVCDPVNGTSFPLLQNDDDRLDFRAVVLGKEEKIQSLQSRIDKRDFLKARAHMIAQDKHLGHWERTHTQYRNTTKRLKKKLSKLRVHLHNYVHHEHYKAGKRLFDNFDVVIVNPLRVQQIAHESKIDNSMGSTARRNMYLQSAGLFVDRLKQVALRSEQKKLIFGFGERGTSKTCVFCGRTEDNLRLNQKTVTCATCGLTMDRDIRGCYGNFFEPLQVAVERQRAA